MNSNTKKLLIRIILLTTIYVLAGIGCSSKPAPLVVYMPERIINEFHDMQEHEDIAWMWIRRGFSLRNCRTAEIKPLTDTSQTPQPAVAERLHQGLQDIFTDRLNENGELDVIVRANIIDVKVKPGRIKSWFTNFDNMPYIELEIVITDSATGLPLVKVIHFRRNKKSLNTAVANLLSDLRQFFSTAL